MSVPAGWSLALDRATRRLDGGRLLLGGTPTRVLRLSQAGAKLVDLLAAGEPVPERASPQTLARRLVDAGLAHPAPVPSRHWSVDDVAVVVPVRDDPVGLAATLAALGPVGEVVVVDDGSAVPVDAAAAGVTVVRHAESRGPAAARRSGRRATGRPLVAFLDADVEPEPGWLCTVLAHFDDDAVAAVAPRVRAVPGGAPRWLAGYEAACSPLDMGLRPAGVRPHGPVAYVPSAALVVRADAFDAVGGFDPELFVGEDVDLVWRLHASGRRVRYEPAGRVRHPSRPTLRAWLRQRYRYGTSAAALARRHGDAVAPLGLSPWSAAAWALVLAGRPLPAAAVATVAVAALAASLRALPHPVRLAVRIAGIGTVRGGRAAADALCRPWWPPALGLALVHPPSRAAVVAAAVVPSVLEWTRRRPALDVVRFTALRLLDDMAYGAGVWAGCVRERSAAALRPRFSARAEDPLTAVANRP